MVIQGGFIKVKQGIEKLWYVALLRIFDWIKARSQCDIRSDLALRA
jgi:hypothetical protein